MKEEQFQDKMAQKHYYSTTINNRFFSCRELDNFTMELLLISIPYVQTYKRVMKIEHITQDLRKLGVTDVKFFIRFLEVGVKSMTIDDGIVSIQAKKAYSEVFVFFKLRPLFSSNSRIMKYVTPMWFGYLQEKAKLKNLKAKIELQQKKKLYDDKTPGIYHEMLTNLDREIEKLQKQKYLKNMMTPNEREEYEKNRKKRLEEGRVNYIEKARGIVQKSGKNEPEQRQEHPSQKIQPQKQTIKPIVTHLDITQPVQEIKDVKRHDYIEESKPELSAKQKQEVPEGQLSLSMINFAKAVAAGKGEEAFRRDMQRMRQAKLRQKMKQQAISQPLKNLVKKQQKGEGRDIKIEHVEALDVKRRNVFDDISSSESQPETNQGKVQASQSMLIPNNNVYNSGKINKITVKEQDTSY